MGIVHKELLVKHFLIKYSRTTGSEAEWHEHIAQFITALNSDAEVKGKIGYRCFQKRGGADYYHLACAVDEAASATLQQQDFFKRYQGHTKAAAGGVVEVVPLELVAETAFFA
jgi:hypothetical protein